MMFERELRDLAFVPRWAIARVIHRQSVAEHSFFTAIYTYQIMQLLDKSPSMQLIMGALLHDLEECFTSDIPGPTKRAIVDKSKKDPFLNQELTARFDINTLPHDYSRDIDFIPFINVASLLDEVLYLAGEYQMGNESISYLYDNSFTRLKEAWYLLPASEKVLQEKWTVLINAAVAELHNRSKLVMG